MANMTNAKELNNAVKNYERLKDKLAESERWIAICNESLEKYGHDRYYKSEITKTSKKVAEIKSKIAEAYTAEVAEELRAREEMIPHFEPVIAEMVNAWIEYAKARMEERNREREKRNADRKNLTREQFNAKYAGCHRRPYYNDVENMEVWTEAGEEKLREEYRQEAIGWIYDLRFRCMDYVGCITDYSKLVAGPKSLEGFVTGTCGKAEVHSIWAGGYNIQRLHVRVLIKRLG